MTKKSSEEKRPNKFVALTSIAAQLGITIYLGAWGGKKLDEHYATEKPWFTIGLTMLALVISMISIVKQLNRMNENE